MFNAVLKSQVNSKEINQENQTKDFKKLATYVLKAKGYRTINGFSAECKTNANYVADLINARATTYPTVQFLKIIADNSEGRVSLNELKLACGYSLYENNDREQIKNIQVSQGDVAWVNFGDNCLDSEQGGWRIAVVFQNNLGNKKSSTTIVLPMTSRIKTSLPTHVLIEKKYGLEYDSIVCCEQVRCVSKRRLIQRGSISKVCELPENLMLKIDVAMAKAHGTIGLHVNEEDAIEMLVKLNQRKVTPLIRETKTNEKTNENKNYNRMPQVAFA